MKIKLTAKTHKAKNRIREAGTDVWRVTRWSTMCIALQGAPGLFIEPIGDDDVSSRHRRWINESNDEDFDFVIL